MSEVLFYINIYVPHHLSSKNNRPIWRGRVGKSEKLRNVEKYLELEFRKAHELKTTFNFDIHAKIIFHSAKYWTKKNIRNKKCGDLVNLLQLPCDCLERARIIENDSLIQSFDGSRIKPSEQNRLEITLYKMNDLDNG